MIARSLSASGLWRSVDRARANRTKGRIGPTTEERTQDALESCSVVTSRTRRSGMDDSGEFDLEDEMPERSTLARVVNGGPHGTRTHDLRVANAALSQLS